MTDQARPTRQRPPVLVVDDEPSMRQFLSVMLKKEGCAIETADSAEAAIGLLNEGARFSMILTDLKMPGPLGGIDVLKHARSLDPACQVVVMTAFASAETARRSISS